jgi:hypothetical protein
MWKERKYLIFIPVSLSLFPYNLCKILNLTNSSLLHFDNSRYVRILFDFDYTQT